MDREVKKDSVYQLWTNKDFYNIFTKHGLNLERTAGKWVRKLVESAINKAEKKGLDLSYKFPERESREGKEMFQYRDTKERLNKARALANLKGLNFKDWLEKEIKSQIKKDDRKKK